jgi:hypothetical protein
MRHNRGPFAPTATSRIAATFLADILGISKFANNPPPYRMTEDEFEEMRLLVEGGIQ